MYWHLIPFIHAVLFGLSAVVLRTFIVGRNPVAFVGGDSARDFASFCFFICLPAIDAGLVGWYAVTLDPGPLLMGVETLRWLGVALLVLASSWVIYAQAFMGSNWSMGVVNDSELVVKGPFAISRHPIYLGIRMTMTGQLLVISSWPALALWLVNELLVQIQVRFEEEVMLDRFGDRYREYCTRVRRWI